MVDKDDKFIEREYFHSIDISGHPNCFQSI